MGQDGDSLVERLLAHGSVNSAREVIRATDERTIEDMIAATEIPAPPFGEGARGAWMEERFRELGLDEVHVDDVGNVLGRLPAASATDTDPVLVAAHLDTVFPAGTDVTVHRDGPRLRAPGITDDARGLAALLAVARAVTRAGVGPGRPLVLVATVGEEGPGDLRGVKHLFRANGPWRRAAAFITLDGTGTERVIHRGVGSRRYRATVRGPGGHSWSDWGLANPIHAVGAAVASLSGLRLPRSPRTVLSVTRTGGGTSVNAIPQEAWLELDLRSESGATLEDIDARVQETLRREVTAAGRRRRRGTPGLTLDIEHIGDRPAGSTAPDRPLVQAAVAATHAVGAEPELVASSTDANVPMALGIPAIGLGVGGASGALHTTQEWYENEQGPPGIERALLVALAAASAD